MYKNFSDFWKANHGNNKDNKIWLRQENMDIGGGKISVSDIDRINEYENIERVEISGLRQDTFEYFVSHYGNRIKFIRFFKNKMIEDLSILSTLTEVCGIYFFHNQRVTKLWDMSSNYKLEGLAFNDFTRLHSLNGIQTAPNLLYLDYGNEIWPKAILEDLESLAGTKIVSFGFSGKEIIHHDISVYTRMPELKYLDFNLNLFPIEELAKIVALCPHLSGYALAPYVKFDTVTRYGKSDVMICGKRKPSLNSEKDAAKIDDYAKQFYALVEQYQSSPG